MKNRILITIALLLSTVGATNAQNDADKTIVSLPDGGYVSLRNETTAIDLRSAILSRMKQQRSDPTQTPATLVTQTIADRNQTVHRILRDHEGRFVFGYDLWISGDKQTRRFKVAVRPLPAELRDTLAANVKSAAGVVSTFPKSTEPQGFDDGGEFSLDLLINKSTGLKIVDVVRVSFDRTRLGDESPGMRARDFTLDAVAMEMKDFSLLLNDNLIGNGKSTAGSTGALLWLYIPEHGRFIFSLVPRPDYSFEKVGIVSGNRIEFEANGDHYQWLSSSPILHEEGVWNLWVLHDAKYTPLLAAQQ